MRSAFPVLRPPPSRSLSDYVPLHDPHKALGRQFIPSPRRLPQVRPMFAWPAPKKGKEDDWSFPLYSDKVKEGGVLYDESEYKYVLETEKQPVRWLLYAILKVYGR